MLPYYWQIHNVPPSYWLTLASPMPCPPSSEARQARYHLGSFLCMQPSSNCLKMFIKHCSSSDATKISILSFIHFKLDISKSGWVPITKELLSNSVFVFSKWPVLIINRSDYLPPSAQMLLTLKLNLKQKMDSSALISLVHRLGNIRERMWVVIYWPDNSLLLRKPLIVTIGKHQFYVMLLVLHF